MAIDVAWSTTGVALITIPKADTTLVSIGPPEVRSYDINEFRGELMALHASAVGAPYSTPFIHTSESTVSGYTYARQVVILPPYRVMFEAGAYVVLLTGANQNFLDVIEFSGVSVVSQNSAGLINVKQLELIVYNGSVCIDPLNGTAGTVLGVNGTHANPVDNLADALTLLISTKLRNLTVLDGVVALAGVLPTFLTVEIRFGAEVQLNGQSVDRFVFMGAGKLSGSGSGSIDVEGCHLSSIGGVQLSARGCGLHGTTVLVAGSSNLTNCVSHLPGTSSPVIDFNGVAASLNIRAYSGGIQYINMSNAASVATHEVIAGRIRIEASCTAGQLVLRGVATVVDNSAGTAVVDDTLSNAGITDSVWDEALAGHLAAGSTGLALATAGSGGLSPAQATQLTEIHRILGLDVAFAVKHGETYIRIPADGSGINIQVTKVGNTTTLQRL